MEVDIIVTTMNRLECLEKTINRIVTCTRTPYKLHIIDDASTDGTRDYVLGLFERGVLETVTLNKKRQGQINNLMVESRIGISPIYVHVDDDVLCPDITPDWLSEGINKIKKHPDIGIMALNHYGARRRDREDRGDIVICKVVGGTYSFIRRRCTRQMGKLHRHDLGTTPQMVMCEWARKLGYKVAYVKGVYCHHIGHQSVLTDSLYKGKTIEPSNWKTFEP
jgi:glycosyltransferase involved in cell wall biosynthesis